MMPARVTALYGAAAGLALGGVVLRLVPPRVPTVDLSSAAVAVPPSPVDPAAQAAALLTYAAITQADLFAPDRRPATRALRAAASSQPDARPASTWRLFGVASGAAGAVALIDADPAIPGAEIYRPGDHIASYTITTIADTLVVLDSPAGRRVLTLRQSERRNP